MSFMYVIYITAAIAIGFGVVFFQNMMLKARQQKYLEQYPDAAKVFLKQKNFLIAYDGVGVATVDDEAAVLFSEGFTKSGFYVKPGNNKVSMVYSSTRPGIMHKTVTTTYGPTDRELKIEPNKSYLLSFDKKAEDFVFEEI